MIVYTQFTNVSMGCTIQSGGPRVGDPCYRSFGVSLLRFLMDFTYTHTRTIGCCFCYFLNRHMRTFIVCLFIASFSTSQSISVSCELFYHILTLDFASLLTATEESCDFHDDVFEMQTKRRGCVRCASPVVGISVHARWYKDQVICQEHRHHYTSFLIYN